MGGTPDTRASWCPVPARQEGRTCLRLTDAGTRISRLVLKQRFAIALERCVAFLVGLRAEGGEIIINV